jgi:DnaK suppressor protein
MAKTDKRAKAVSGSKSGAKSAAASSASKGKKNYALKKTAVKAPSGKVSKKSKVSATASKIKQSRATEDKVKTKKSKNNASPRDKKIQVIKIKLLEQRNALLNEAESALNELPGQTVFPDLGDQATAETDRNFMLRLRGREQRLLKKIDEAIDRIDNGSFGICDDCGNEIDIKRLEARPVTTMCIECKTLQEEEEKLREA